MPTPSKEPLSKKKVEVKTQAKVYSAVRLSMVIMVTIAMLCTSFILAALLIRLIPVTDIGGSTASGAKFTRSADGYIAGELLVKFAPGATQLDRTQALQAALKNPVRVTVQTTVKKRVGFRTVTQAATAIRPQAVKVTSITPIVDNNLKLTALGYDTRAKRGTSAEVQATADELKQWFVVRVNPAGADLNQISASLIKQTKIVKVELNRKVSAAATRSVASTSAAATIKISDAQKLVGVLTGDANNDRIVDGKDLRMLANYLFGNNGPKPTNLAAADVNHDGNVDIADFMQLAAMLSSSYKFTPRDLTGDGTFDVSDLNFMVAYLSGKGVAPSPLSLADWDGDGQVDSSDLAYMVDYLYGDWNSGTMQYGSGDVNGDGVVNELDITALAAYLNGQGSAPKPLTVADLDLDGLVDFSDLFYLIDRIYNAAAPTSSGQTVSAASLPSVHIISGVVTVGDTPPSSPAFLVGDTNADSVVDSKDIDYLVKYLFSNGSAPSPLLRADLDGNSLVDVSDLYLMLTLVSKNFQTKLAAADLNSDGAVNAADVQAIVDYLSGKNASLDLTKADVTLDGLVDISDWAALADFVAANSGTPSICPVVRTVGNVSFLNGDVNADGSITSADGTMLAKQVFASGPPPSLADRADVNCDGSVNAFDVQTFTSLQSAQQTSLVTPTQLSGDANADGLVNGSDIVKSFSAASKGELSTGNDVNRDGVVNYQDTYDLVALLGLDKATKPLVDLNSDGKINRVDASKLMRDVISGVAEAKDISGDVNADGAVNIGDAIAFIKALDAQSPTTAVLVGDANADGLVNCQDAKVLYATQYQQAAAITPDQRADVNADGKVNQVDLFLLAQRSCGNGTVTTPSNVRIALLDTGLQVSVTVMKDIVALTSEKANGRDNNANGYKADVVGWNTTGNNANITDCTGHGSDLAQMLIGKNGITNYAKVIPVKVLDCKGNGTAVSVAQGLVYATIRGSDIAELPLSGFGTSAMLTDIVSYAKASGMLVLGAAGNDTTAISRVFPANVLGVLSVSATTNDGKALASYSNTGAAVSAPGASAGVRFEGTSVSTTYVAGTAALSLTKNPGQTLKDLEQKLAPITPGVSPKKGKLLDAVKVVQ